MTLIAQDGNGNELHTSYQGEYPDGIVVLTGTLNKEYFRWEYSTEWNPRGKTLAELRRQELLNHFKSGTRLIWHKSQSAPWTVWLERRVTYIESEMYESSGLSESDVRDARASRTSEYAAEQSENVRKYAIENGTEDGYYPRWEPSDSYYDD